MSSALAIAAVTAVMKDLLDNAMIDGSIASVTTPVAVTALAPDLVEALPKGPRLNLFMYHVSPNQGWRNVGLPSRNGAGERTANAPLALDLHYMLTAYATEDFHAEILLGYAMQLLHEVPVLTRAAINKALSPAVAAAAEDSLSEKLRMLAESHLAAQAELVKITPEAMSTEEMSKLWAAINGHYRPTAAYRASVVLIESTFPTRAPLPVIERRLHVATFRRPVIDSVEPQIARVGDVLKIRGRDLNADAVKVRFGEMPAGVLLARTDTEITVAVPDTLRAGVNIVTVEHPLDLGTGAGHEPHGGAASNAVAFMLAPRITKILPATAPPGRTLTITVEPPVARAQSVRLLLNNPVHGERSIVLPARGMDASEVPPVEPDPITDLAFTIPATVPSGDWLVRVEVDGAQSMLDRDDHTHLFSGPVVSIP